MNCKKKSARDEIRTRALKKRTGSPGLRVRPLRHPGTSLKNIRIL